MFFPYNNSFNEVITWQSIFNEPSEIQGFAGDLVTILNKCEFFLRNILYNKSEQDTEL